ncbi:MAG: hypothetical protein QOH51_2951 [Acidobacteriota bacterium]|jgi:hypothetical protein|nr:hypothetical protein [Acidobacteriota bacterium]
MQSSANAATQIPVWVPIVASLIGGGAMGALITAAITNYRNRRQPVGYRKEVIEVFKKNPEFPSLQALLMVGDDVTASRAGFTVNNLSVARYTFVNNGNQDISEFKFGVNLGEPNKAVDVKTEAPDRFHVLESLTPVSIDNQKTDLDFALKPFNRGDTYILNVYFTYKESPGTINLATPHSTQFIELSASEGIKGLLFNQQSLQFATSVLLFLAILLISFWIIRLNSPIGIIDPKVQQVISPREPSIHSPTPQ